MSIEKSGSGPTQKANQINSLPLKIATLGPPSEQIELFHIEKQIEHDGVEMGVLEDGTPYLSESGLARMCGIDRKVLNRLAVNWQEERLKERGKAIDELLIKSGYIHRSLFLKSEFAGGYQVNAYTEPVCLAMLEYYAFITREPKQEAQHAFRSLARIKFREFVYGAVGYSPEQIKLDSWKHFHDRVDLTKDSVPIGYFGIYNEIASMIVPMISAGVAVNDKLIPDISVGIAWSNHWKKQNLATRYGERIHYEHNYPEYYPQAKSNPQEPYAYPDEALGEFKRWLRQHYIATKLPTYLSGKVKDKSISFASATMATLALSSNSKVTGKGLPPPQ
ncbi:hypothetical protein os4_21220 [Comamonadaceae bacterium OS-4]|nr:hypothetical protein os4_21220 [Comamonadaceae bacterium OS-4]